MEGYTSIHPNDIRHMAKMCKIRLDSFMEQAKKDKCKEIGTLELLDKVVTRISEMNDEDYNKVFEGLCVLSYIIILRPNLINVINVIMIRMINSTNVKIESVNENTEDQTFH